ncbi:nuclear transport factor 2 family protein [Stenotrophomonas maltophilia]
MNALDLPEPIAAYFAAGHDLEALARCFSAQAVLKDDGHILAGVDAIKAFLAEASAKYSATSVPCAVERQEKCHVVRADVSGNFPGSPILLTYRFEVERGLIAALEITA